MKKDAGFTLIELLIVVVVIGILAGIAVIGYNAVIKNTRNSLSTTRLMQYAEAQNKFKTIRGRRRYATLDELCLEGLLPETVARMDASCVQTAINGFIIIPGTETSGFLQGRFFAVLQFETRPAGETSPIYCIGEDGVLRRSDAGSLDVCTITSTPLQP